MAKDIDLNRATGGEMPTPPKKEKRPDPSGMRPLGTNKPVNALPLGAGQVVKTDTRRPSMTPQELATLQQAGWTPGDPIPPNVQEFVALAQAENQRIEPPVPMNTPPLHVETVDITQYDPSQQAQIQQAVAQGTPLPQGVQQPRTPPPASAPNLQGVFAQPAAAQPHRTPQPAQPQGMPGQTQPTQVPQRPMEAVSVASQAVPGWQNPSAPGQRPTVPNPQAYPDPGMPPQGWPTAQNQPGNAQIDVDIPMAAQQPPQEYAIPPQPQMAQPDTAPKAAPQPEKVADVGLDHDFMHNCPHCGWDLGMPAIPEPSYGEKQSFLQSILGQTPFIRDYEMFGGAVRARFRTLSTKEVDVIFKQVMYQRERGEIPTIEDYWELVNRYRLYLQLVRLESKTAEGFLHELPMGYSEEANPNAGTYWRFQINDPRQTGLPLIEAYLLKEVFKTEVLQRTVNNMCGQFNRLVAKLEAVVDNSDFWNATGGQS